MNLKIRLVVCLLFVCTCSIAQEQEEQTVLEVLGKVVHSVDKTPVTASITYESMPYGDKIGIFTGSSFTFQMEDGVDYAIVVKASGFNPYRGMIKSASQQEGKIDEVIELVPEGSEHVILLEELIFAVRSDVITEKSHAELDQLVAMLDGDEGMKIQLEGHTDWQGNAKQNLKLSERRVESVKNYLVNKGISRKRIKTKAFGGTRPLSRARDSESRRKNRRVEVRILAD